MKKPKAPKANLRLVHLGTRIQSVFALADEDGNVSPGSPVNVEGVKFSEASFLDAFRKIESERTKARAALLAPKGG